MERPHAQQVLEGQEAVAAALAHLEALRAALRQPIAEGLDALVDAMSGLLDCADGAGAAASGADLRRLKSQLLEVARTFASIQPYPASQGAPAARVVRHFNMTCCAIHAVALLASELGAKLAPAEAAQLAVCLSHVMRKAPGFLSAHTVAARTNPLTLDTLCESLARALDASGAMLRMLRSTDVPEQLYASSVFSAETLVPYLQALTDGLEVALAAPAERTRDLTPGVLADYTQLLRLALRRDGIPSMVAAMAARPALYDGIAVVLLAHVLPRAAEALLAAGSGAPDGVRSAVFSGAPGVVLLTDDDAAFALVDDLGRLLTVRELLPAVQRHLWRPGGAAIMQHVAAVLRAMPGAAPAGWTQAAFSSLLTGCTGLVSIVVYLISSSATRTLSGAANSQGPAARAPAPTADQQQAAWELVGAVPALARLIRAAVNTQLQPTVAHVVSFILPAMFLLSDLPKSLTSPAQLAALAEAVPEVARLTPLLSRVDEQWQQLLASCPPVEQAALSMGLGSAPKTIVGLLLQHVWYKGSHMAQAWTASQPDQDPVAALHAGGEQVLAALPSALWQAHSSSCCLLHHLAGSRTHVFMVRGGRSEDWRLTRQNVDSWFIAAVQVAMAALQATGDQDAERLALTRVRAMCAAHWAAMQAGAAAVHTLQAHERFQPEPDPDPHGSAGLAAEALLVLSTHHPLLLGGPDAQGRSPLDVMMAELQAAGEDPVRNVLPRLLLCTGTEGGQRMAAALLRGGLVALAMRRATELQHVFDASMPPVLPDGYPLHIFQLVADAAQQAADELRRQGSISDGASGSSAASEAGACASVAGAAGTNLSGDPSAQAGSTLPAVSEQAADPRAELLSAAAQLRELASRRDAAGLQAAEQAAALLQRFWALPQQVEAARVELAQAATARSCANLRCANAELGGGPAVGEGVGSKRCSGCRVAWYCGTTCSHADWRAGGHKRVCKLLALAGRGV